MADDEKKQEKAWPRRVWCEVTNVFLARGWDQLGGAYWRNPHAFVVWPILFAASFALVTALWFVAVLAARVGGAAHGGQPEDINKLLLALAGVIGAPFVVWRVLIAAQTNRIAQATAAENSRIAQEQLYTNLLTKAVEQLGATREQKTIVETIDKDSVKKFETKSETVPNTEVRLGGIYALEKLARDYEPLHWSIMEILCAYVRKNAGPPRPLPAEVRSLYLNRHSAQSEGEGALLEGHWNKIGFPLVDVQAALMVIGRRSASRRNLEDDLRRGLQSGQDYRLDLTNCWLARAKLDGLHFSNAKFDGTSLEGASLIGTHLVHASLEEARMEGVALLGAHLEGASLIRARLEGALLNGVHSDGAHFDWANLDGASLDGANFRRASLHSAHLNFALLAGAHLEGAVLVEAHFDGALLYETHLECTLLRGAHFWGAQLSNPKLSDAMLDSVDLKLAAGLTTNSLADAWGNHKTVLPDGVARPENERWVGEYAGAEELSERSRRWEARRNFWLANASH